MELSHRRSFLKKTALAAVGIAIAPSIFAKERSKKKVKHVILCILSGGVRKDEIFGIRGNYMPLVFGNSDNSLKRQGSLFSNFRYSRGELSHLAAETALLSGNYRIKESSSAADYNELNDVKISNLSWTSYNDNSDIVFEKLLQNDHSLSICKIEGADIAHSNYEAYCNYLKQADVQISNLWKKVQQEKRLKNETVLIVVPEHGRNKEFNSIMNLNGIGGLDHNDDYSREIFCLIAGPSDLIQQNQTVTTNAEIIDLLPTMGDLLGFSYTLNSSGRILSEAYSKPL